MKKLLESCLSLIDSAGDMFARPADNWEAEASRVRSAVRTALAALEPGATPAEAILAQADRMEGEGDAKAQPIRAIINGERGYWKTNDVSVMIARTPVAPPRPRQADEPCSITYRP